MHEVPYLYRNFHSHHHRLYVPYAFGALYNHPVEGFLLDTLGATIAEAASAMTVRQKILLFGFASLKTVDDHSGYKIWWDPMQVSPPSMARGPRARARVSSELTSSPSSSSCSSPTTQTSTISTTSRSGSSQISRE